MLAEVERRHAGKADLFVSFLRASDPMCKTRNFGVAYCDFFWYTLYRQPESCL